MHIFGERKNSCSSKFVQLLLLNRLKTRWSKNRAAQGFHFINSFISNFFGPNSKTCTCEVRAAQGRVSRGLTVEFKLEKIIGIWKHAGKVRKCLFFKFNLISLKQFCANLITVWDLSTFNWESVDALSICITEVISLQAMVTFIPWL